MHAVSRRAFGRAGNPVRGPPGLFLRRSLRAGGAQEAVAQWKGLRSSEGFVTGPFRLAEAFATTTDRCYESRTNLRTA